MNYKKNYIYIFFFLAVFSHSCKSVKTVGPEENYLNVQEILDKQVSVINIPIQYNLLDLEKQVNREVKDLIFEDNTIETDADSKYHIKVFKRDLVTFNAVNDLINITVPLKIWSKVGVDLSNLGIGFSQFKETQFELNINFTTKVGITPDWKLTTQTASNGFNWVTKPKIKLGIIEIPLDSFVGAMIDKQQDQIATEIDKQLKKHLDIKKYIQDAWLKIQDPVLVSDEHNAWLKIIPIEISVSPLKGQGKMASLTVGFKALTQTVIGEKPTKKIALNNLPPLKQVESLPNEVAIGLSAEISHERINSLLKENIINKKFSYNEGKQEIQITSIDFYGSGKNIVIKAGLEGSMKGIIFLKGIPYFDSVRQALAIKELDYDIKTKDKLIKTASWLAHGKFAKSLEDAIVIPIGKQLKEAKAAIDSNISNKQIAKGVFLNGKVNELQPTEIMLTPKSVIALVVAKGIADIKIQDM